MFKYIILRISVYSVSIGYFLNDETSLVKYPLRHVVPADRGHFILKFNLPQESRGQPSVPLGFHGVNIVQELGALVSPVGELTT